LGNDVSTVDDYASGRILDGVKKTEQMIDEFSRTKDPKIRKALEEMSKDSENYHFLADMKQLKGLIRKAKIVAVGPRVCLEIHSDCEKPMESVFLDELADALIHVGKARKVTKREGYIVLKKGLESGYPHVVTIVSGKPLELCNTCSECCVLWRREKLGIRCIRK